MKTLMKILAEIGILSAWFAVAVLLGLSLFAFVRDASAQNFPGGFRCVNASAPSGSPPQMVLALFRADGYLAFYRVPDGAFTRQNGCGGASIECANAVRACFGVEIGIETPVGNVVAFEGLPTGRIIGGGFGIWFALFAIGVLVVLLAGLRRFRRQRGG